MKKLRILLLPVFLGFFLIFPSVAQAALLKAANQNVELNENSSIDIELTGINQPPYDARISANPIHGTLSKVSTYVYSYSTSSYVGADSFTFQLKDDRGRWSNIATVSITVNNVNDAPVAYDQFVVTNKNTPLDITLSASDADNDNLSYTIDGPSHGTLTGEAPYLSYDPDANYAGSDAFTFTVNDGELDSNTATVSITVNQTNTAPVAHDQSDVLTFRNTSVNITLTASDVDGDSLSYSLISNPSHGSLSGTLPQLSYTPSSNYTGSDSFQFKANDGTQDSNIATIFITVDLTNDNPTANAQSLSTDEDTPLSIVLTGADPESQALSYSIVTYPNRGTLTGSGQNWLYIPFEDINGNDSFLFKVSDGVKNSTNAKISITILEVNDAPTANSQSTSTDEDRAKTITLSGSDPDGDTLSFSMTSEPLYGVAVINGNQLTYTPAANKYGDDFMTITASDGIVSSEPALISFTINPVNDAPTASPQQITTDEDTPASFSLLTFDVDGDVLSATVVFQAIHGTVSIDKDLIATYTPSKNYSGTDAFTYRVSDGMFNSELTTVDLTITEVAEVPDPEYSQQYSIMELTGDTSVLTNANGAVLLPDGTLGFIYGEGGALNFGRMLRPGQPDSEMSTQTLVSGVTPGSITSLGDTIIIVYQVNSSSINEMRALISYDAGITFDPSISAGPKGPGAAVPTVCLWQEMSVAKAAVAWTASPSESGDEGPLYLAEISDGLVDSFVQIGSSQTTSAPSLSCDSEGQFLALRDQVTSTRLGIMLSERSSSGWSDPSFQFYGADPSLCSVADKLWVGSSDNQSVFLTKSSNRGLDWDEPLELDDSAKFIHVSCGSQGRVAAFWGDWPTRDDVLDDATREVTGKVSLDDGITWVTHRPVGHEVFQGPATADLNEDVIAVVIKDSNRGVIRIATTKDSAYDGLTLPLVFSIHHEPSGARKCDVEGVRCVTDEEFQHNMEKMKELIEALNKNGLKGTFEMDIQWFTRLSEYQLGEEIFHLLIDNGHEIALHHHGWDTTDWDGYSDNPLAYTQVHSNYPQLAAQPMSAFIDIIHNFETQYAYEIVSIEGTDFEYDWQDEWDFKTTDASGEGSVPLNDPEGVCQILDLEGRPAWSEVYLPSTPYEDGSLPAWGLTHTHFNGFTAGCQQVKVDNILDYLNQITEDLLGTTNAVNLVFHTEDYAQGDEVQAVFDAFFSLITSDYLFMEGMTVRDYMCNRVGICSQ